MAPQQAFAPRPLPDAVADRVLGALAAEHDRDPFLPTDARGTAHRVAVVLAGVGVDCTVVRGLLDVGGAELDHLFVVVADDRVVDAALPVHDASFLDRIRAWVAGDLGHDQLVAAARPLGLGERVVGLFPPQVRYRGAPLWGRAA